MQALRSRYRRNPQPCQTTGRLNLPETVIQPQSEEELVELVRWASENRIPLTPRGKATSGYGGIIPVEKGVVVDFYRMNRLLRIDPNTDTATVQAGVVWEKLEKELLKNGLMFNSRPNADRGISRTALTLCIDRKRPFIL
jgi:FAD/FMN-containing dehydrogenase